MHSAAHKEHFWLQMYWELANLRDVIQDDLGPVISPEESEHYLMDVSDLDWRPEGKMDSGPRFCDPFPADEFDQLFDAGKVMAQNWLVDYWPSDSDTSSTSRFEQAQKLECCLSLCLGAADWPGEIARHGDWAFL